MAFFDDPTVESKNGTNNYTATTANGTTTPIAAATSLEQSNRPNVTQQKEWRPKNRPVERSPKQHPGLVTTRKVTKSTKVVAQRSREARIRKGFEKALEHRAKAKHMDEKQWGFFPHLHSCDSWRSCFKVNHTCPDKCRDSRAALGKPPPRPTEQNATTASTWVPDVTHLRTMYLEGRDDQGRVFPPPLVTPFDHELCGSIGRHGDDYLWDTNHPAHFRQNGMFRYKDEPDNHKVLFDAVPIRGLAMGEEESGNKHPSRSILCLMYTVEQSHHGPVRAARETWAPGCDGFLAFSTADDPRIPAIFISHEGPENYNNMWQKVRSIWKFVGQHYLEDFDFFHLGGEDMYLLPQNLRKYLSEAVDDPQTQDLFAGRRFFNDGNLKDLFNTGGPGYSLSQATLRKLTTGERPGLDDKRCEPHKKHSAEDVYLSRCLKKVYNIEPVDTRDAQQRERYHHFSPAYHYLFDNAIQNDWYTKFTKPWPQGLKENCCAPDSVSFHYIKQPAMVRHIHALLHLCD